MEPNDRENEKTTEPPSGLLSELEKKLYSRKNQIPEPERAPLHAKRWNVSQEWEGEGDLLEYKKKEQSQKASPYTKLFLVSLFFFVITAMAAGFSLLGGKSDLSPENVTLSLFGPVSVRGGDTLALQVMIENKNKVALSDVTVGANFPDGARYPNNPTQPLTLYRKNIGTIGPGEIRTETVSAILLGADNTSEDVKIYLEFGINGSSASYTNSKIFTVNLTAAPLTIQTQLLNEITSGQDVTLGIDAVSNSTAPLNNILLKVDYPAGFTFESADPAPFSGNNVWNLGNITLGDTHHISVKGKIEGENGQQKIFRIYGGASAQTGTSNIDTTFSTLLSAITIQKPFLNANLLVNGSSDPNYSLVGRSGLNIGVYWTNTLLDKITNGEITVTVGGDIIDPSKVQPKDGGLYSADKQTVFWDSRSTPALSTIDAGGKGNVDFTIGLLPFVRPDKSVFRNPVINVSVGLKGSRLSETNVPETITSLSSRSIKVGTTADFTSRLYYFTGPITNSGPLPPKVGQETTYTVDWKVLNTVNDITGAKVTATLPSYVRWVGRISPDSANVTYNPSTGQVVWNIGTIPSGAGYQTSPAEVQFQIGLTPVTSQAGVAPTIVFPSVFDGTDQFTTADINSQTPPMTTVLNFEPQAGVSSSVVSP